MRLIVAVAASMLFAELCAIEEIGVGGGLITVHNNDAEVHEIVVSDNPQCVVGLKTELRGNTTRTFDIDENGAFFCVGGAGGVKVTNGARYVVRGGAVGPE